MKGKGVKEDRLGYQAAFIDALYWVFFFVLLSQRKQGREHQTHDSSCMYGTNVCVGHFCLFWGGGERKWERDCHKGFSFALLHFINKIYNATLLSIPRYYK